MIGCPSSMNFTTHPYHICCFPDAHSCHAVLVGTHAACTRACLPAALSHMWHSASMWRQLERRPVHKQPLGPLLLQVCGNSAKVQLNSGILERRYQNWEAALRHFERARTIEPGYCEPDYWVGLTLVNQGKDIERGIQVSKDETSSCKVPAQHDRAGSRVRHSGRTHVRCNTTDPCATEHLKGRGVGQGVCAGDAGQLCCAALDSLMKHSVSVPKVLAAEKCGWGADLTAASLLAYVHGRGADCRSWSVPSAANMWPSMLSACSRRCMRPCSMALSATTAACRGSRGSTGSRCPCLQRKQTWRTCRLACPSELLPCS